MKETPLDQLIAIMARLRDPDRGCPWDLEQNFASIAPYTIEEAYEVADAVEKGDMVALKDELGDLLLQVVFHSRLAEEAGFFKFDDTAESISAKLIRRHPHLFAGDIPVSALDQSQKWETIKAAERKAKSDEKISALDGVAAALPALLRAEKIQKRAARVGFDWSGSGQDAALPVLDKIIEEAEEIREAVTQDLSPERVDEEVGDLLFAVVNLGRKLNVDPETALRRATAKFSWRFQTIEQKLHERGLKIEDQTMETLDSLWEEVKARN